MFLLITFSPVKWKFSRKKFVEVSYQGSVWNLGRQIRFSSWLPCRRTVSQRKMIKTSTILFRKRHSSTFIDWTILFPRRRCSTCRRDFAIAFDGPCDGPLHIGDFRQLIIVHLSNNSPLPKTIWYPCIRNVFYIILFTLWG